MLQFSEKQFRVKILTVDKKKYQLMKKNHFNYFIYSNYFNVNSLHLIPLKKNTEKEIFLQ